MGGGRSAGPRRGAGTGWGAVRGRRAGRPPEGPTSDGQIRARVTPEGPGQDRWHSKPRMLSPVTLGHTDTAPGFLQHHRCRSGRTPLIRSLSVSPGEGTPTSLPTTPTKPAPCPPRRLPLGAPPPDASGSHGIPGQTGPFLPEAPEGDSSCGSKDTGDTGPCRPPALRGDGGCDPVTWQPRPLLLFSSTVSGSGSGPGPSGLRRRAGPGTEDSLSPDKTRVQRGGREAVAARHRSCKKPAEPGVQDGGSGDRREQEGSRRTWP